MPDATVLLTDDPDRFRAQVRSGDLLLFDSTSWIAGLTKWADAAPFNHVSLALNQDYLIEANRQAPEPCDIADHRLAPAANQAVRKVCLHRRLAAHGISAITLLRPVDRPDSLGPVLRRAEAFLDEGDLFSVVDLALIGQQRFLINYRDELYKHRLAFKLLTTLSTVMLGSIGDGERSLSCSEFVYRCFTEADTTPPRRGVWVPPSPTNDARDVGLSADPDLFMSGPTAATLDQPNAGVPEHPLASPVRNRGVAGPEDDPVAKVPGAPLDPWEVFSRLGGGINAEELPLTELAQIDLSLIAEVDEEAEAQTDAVLSAELDAAGAAYDAAFGAGLDAGALRDAAARVDLVMGLHVSELWARLARRNLLASHPGEPGWVDQAGLSDAHRVSPADFARSAQFTRCAVLTRDHQVVTGTQTP